MSIITKTGDDGSTGLMYKRRVSKTDPRVAAYGTVDELNAALGLARASTAKTAEKETLLSIQRELVAIMGELATDPADRDKYLADGHPVITAEAVANLEILARQVEARLQPIRTWIMPGDNPHAAALDLARTVCRRAERGIWALGEGGQVVPLEVGRYLNRLADLLWLMARFAEGHLK
jgi:cob(I)alamin adenosyltransferase